MNLEDYLYVAKKSPVHSKFVAVLYYRNKVVSYGYNYVTNISSHNYMEHYEPNKHSVHAEKHAILNLKNKSILSKCKIRILKINSGGIVSECGPCPMCKKLLTKYKCSYKPF